MRIGVSFMNGIGNFIFFTAALKILKQWGYDDITLHTHEKFLSNPAMMEVADGLFTDIIPEKPVIEDYDHYIFNQWSNPGYMFDFAKGWLIRDIKVHDFRYSGIHEVMLYLTAIGAGWDDFDGYILNSKQTYTLPNNGKYKIALANPDPTRSQQVSFKTWDKMPELSQTLIDLGFDVYLVGASSEMNGCAGTDYTENVSLLEMASIIEQCDMLIAPSTCAAIIADAVGTPVLSLEGPIMNARTNPLQVPYEIVRHNITCAPCHQQKMMRFCIENSCMKSIEVKHVIQKMLEFKNRLEYDHRKIIWDINPIEKSDDVKYFECNETVAYLFPCFERFEILSKCLDSFKESNPQKGAVLFLNDASLDPRVQMLIDNFECDGLIKYIYQRDWIEKYQKLSTYLKTPSTHAYNFLLNEIIKLAELGTYFSYINIIDPDAVFKKNWSQYIINLHKQVSKNIKIGMISGLNYTTHPIYDTEENQEVFVTDEGQKYRFRNGANLHYMMSYDFFKNVCGFYPIENKTPSADVSKSEELAEKGYRTLIPVPSLMQQIGALGSSFSRLRSNEIALDY